MFIRMTYTAFSIARSISATLADTSAAVIINFVVAALAILTVSGPGNALAEERPTWRDDPLSNRFVFAVGLFAPNLDTQVRLDSSTGMAGTEIDFESTLGMDDTDLLPLVLGYYRVAKKHRINYQHFKLARHGNSVSDLEIRFGEVTFPANLPLSSYFEVDVYSLGYSYSLIQKKKMELAFSVGLQFQDIEMGIAGSVGPGFIVEDADVVAPMPTFGGSFDYAISDKWIFTSLVGIFGLEIDLGDDSDFSGEIVQINTGIAYKAFKNVAFALQYNYFRVDVDVNDTDWSGTLKYRYSGPVLAIAAYF